MQSPTAYIDLKRMELDMVRTRLANVQERRIAASRRDYVRLAVSLDTLSPLKVLGRGYAVASAEDGRVLRSVEDTETGAHIRVRLGDGALGCRVEQREKGEQFNG